MIKFLEGFDSFYFETQNDEDLFTFLGIKGKVSHLFAECPVWREKLQFPVHDSVQCLKVLNAIGCARKVWNLIDLDNSSRQQILSSGKEDG